MALAETERLVARLGDADVRVDSLVANRLFEIDEGCPCDRCRRDAERHNRRLGEIREPFDLPIRLVPELDAEAQGLDVLAQVGPHLLSERED